MASSFNFLLLSLLLVISSCADDSGLPIGGTSSGSSKVMFLSTNIYTGNLGGIAGADSICQNDSKNPGGTFKALIVGATRRACTTAFCASDGAAENLDWVLTPNTTYYDLNGSVVGTTNANGLFTFPLQTALSATTTDDFTWTGLTPNWTNGSFTCTNWTIGDSSASGFLGDGGRLTDEFINTMSYGCQTFENLICVQQ